jgi:hypothetical protein
MREFDSNFLIVGKGHDMAWTRPGYVVALRHWTEPPSFDCRPDMTSFKIGSTQMSVLRIPQVQIASRC